MPRPLAFERVLPHPSASCRSDRRDYRYNRPRRLVDYDNAHPKARSLPVPSSRQQVEIYSNDIMRCRSTIFMFLRLWSSNGTSNAAREIQTNRPISPVPQSSLTPSVTMIPIWRPRCWLVPSPFEGDRLHNRHFRPHFAVVRRQVCACCSGASDHEASAPEHRSQAELHF